jgi:esterase/lipase
LRTLDPKALSLLSKVKILLTGIDNPKPKHSTKSTRAFDVVILGDQNKLSCWSFKVQNAKGIVILFHGYAGEKSSLLGRSDFFNQSGYNTLLVDFLGSGDSDGNSTSIGFTEAEQVKRCYDYLLTSHEKNIFLFGTSMGAAAVLKAVDHYKITPKAILLECPFGYLYKTVCARFKLMGVPAIPMAGLLTFCGGAQHGYWAFNHNPAEYAKGIDSPTLILFGEQDDRVSREEIDMIFKNLKGFKMLKTYSKEGHNFFTPANQRQWTEDVSGFLRSIKSR